MAELRDDMPEMKNYHVHVYKVVGKMEVDTACENAVEAKKNALECAKESPRWEESDCKMIAMEFEI